MGDAEDQETIEGRLKRVGEKKNREVGQRGGGGRGWKNRARGKDGFICSTQAAKTESKLSVS